MPVCHQGDGGAVIVNGVSARDDERAGSRQQRKARDGALSTRAFEAVPVYAYYNTYVQSTVQLELVQWVYILFVLCLGLRLFGSEREVTRGSLLAGRRRAGRFVRQKRPLVLPESFPSPSVPFVPPYLQDISIMESL
jgi:hypothetical protein